MCRSANSFAQPIVESLLPGAMLSPIRLSAVLPVAYAGACNMHTGLTAARLYALARRNAFAPCSVAAIRGFFSGELKMLNAAHLLTQSIHILLSS